ncbi:hypothetical protein A5792_28875 [Mycolicibacterium peregrinum]|uniref:Uncharacterized protein n=1 Tax=Mycolicibacterium peregrinum TaxID=43304 RepID=A0A1A0QSJ9_MYCPR|nr:hypothetical protein [Mycolicibacterium peregrinum]OBB25092.1 hypothetical protein A5792_28875 [Mycolicibacterium peregrinum]
MGVWVIDPDWYFQTAEVLGDASSQLASAVGTIADHAKWDTTKMAGNDSSVGAAWGSWYDKFSADTIEGTAMLATAWSSLANRIYQAGVNHAWAEFRAGRGRLPTPGNLPPRPSVNELPMPSLPTAVGDNGPGLHVVYLPGLDESLGGVEIPNADTDKLPIVAASWNAFAATITATVGEVTHRVRRPDPELPDATAFYNTITSLAGPADALGADAMSMSTLTDKFSSGVLKMRADITNELRAMSAMHVLGAVVAAAATRVSGTVSVKAGVQGLARRVRLAGENIRRYVATLQTIASLLTTMTPRFTHADKAKVDKERTVDIEIFDPDGTRSRHYRIPLSKWLSWLDYLKRGGDEWQWDRWNDTYDRLKENSANGWWWDQWAAAVMGYTPEHGWVDQWGSKKEHLDLVPVQGRVWDWANPDLQHVVENKSGALDLNQLALDEIALQRGWSVTWNINAHYAYSGSELAALERLEKLYPGRFTVNRL